MFATIKKCMIRNSYKKFLLAFLPIMICVFTFGQANEIKIRFIGNCGVFMTDGKSNIYVDFPYKSGAFNYMKYAPSQIDSIKSNSIFIFTHKHPDHYSGKLVKKFKGKTYGPWNVDELEKLSSIPEFSVKAFKTKHHFSFNHYSYLVTWHNKKIFFSGDTENADTIGKMAGMDWAFVPYWIMIDAKEKNMKIDTKMIAIYHLYPDQKLNVTTPDKIILMDKPGQVISIPY